MKVLYCCNTLHRWQLTQVVMAMLLSIHFFKVICLKKRTDKLSDREQWLTLNVLQLLKIL